MSLVRKNIPIIHPGGVVSRDQQKQLVEMERVLLSAIAEAKDAGVPQGLIVAVLHAQTTIQTNHLIGCGADS